MIRTICPWLFAILAVGIAIGAVLPPALPFADALATLVPAGPAIALVGVLFGGRSAASALALVAALACSTVVGREYLGGPAPGRDGHAMIVVTHNVSSENVDPQATVAALADSGADVLLLQETDGRLTPHLDALRPRYPYGHTCRGRCSMAIVSRWPLDRVRWRFHDAAGKAYGPALYTTIVHLPWGGEARLATVHLSRKDTGPARELHRSELADAVQRAGTTSTVLAGDFNLTPWGSAMRALDDDMRPMVRVTRAMFSFPARWQQRSAPMPLIPIDHLYAGPAWAVASVQRLPKTGSDHYPIRVKLLWRRRGV
jgi:endonuclease/exonuclease/phosphatase (EEP) superfamily protein YafD